MDIISQMIHVFTVERLYKGSEYCEPTISPAPEAFVVGQIMHVCGTLCDKEVVCPYPLHTTDAAHFAAGRLYERRVERVVSEAYSCGRRYMVLP